MSSESVGALRRDVQGMRAIAVIAVFLFHLYPNHFSQGYLGVDVFVVISGFVVSTVVLREVRGTGSFRVGNFVRRRARRLLPVLFFVLAVTTLAWGFFAPVDTHGDILGAAVSAVTIGANFFFYERSTDYFADSASPLIHLWSLSMEEQFYVLLVMAVSALMVVRRKLPRLRRIPLVGGTWLALSLGFLVIVAGTSFFVPTASLSEFQHFLFYFPIGRAWQFLAGIAVAATPEQTSPKWLTHYGHIFSQTAIVGLLAVMLINRDSANSFLSWQRIAVTYLTAAAIFLGSTKPDSGFGSSPSLVVIGDRSYSIYLWHIPIITFWELLTGAIMHIVAAAAVVLVTSEISYRLVECPFRSRNVPTARHWSVPIVSAFVIGSLFVVTKLDAIPKYTSIQSSDRWQLFPGNITRDGCSNDGQRYVCGVLGSDVDVVLIGDSHAMSLAHVFVEAAESLGLSFYVSVQPGCRTLGSPTVLDMDLPPSNDCENAVRLIYSKLDASRTHLFVAECPTRPGNGCPDPELVNESKSYFNKRVLNLLKLKETVAKLYLVQELPFVNDQLRNGRTIFRRLVNSDVNTRLGINFNLEEYLNLSRIELQNFAMAYPESIEIVDLRDVLCDFKSCISTDGQGRDVWANEDHLTIYGAELVRPAFERLMNEAAAGRRG